MFFRGGRGRGEICLISGFTLSWQFFSKKFDNCCPKFVRADALIISPGNNYRLCCPSIDDDAAQRVPLCRRMWLLSPKAETQTRPQTVQADPCRLGGGLRCWFLRTRFASATSVCCCSNVVSPLSQTTRHSSRSLANSSSKESCIYLRTT